MKNRGSGVRFALALFLLIVFPFVAIVGLTTVVGVLNDSDVGEYGNRQRPSIALLYRIQTLRVGISSDSLVCLEPKRIIIKPSALEPGFSLLENYRR